jgi:membrane protein DedA with SNARE-associated domain
MEELIVHYGLLAVFIGAVAEGDVTLFLAGVVAHLGLLEAPLALATGVAGNFVSDSIWFSVGRSSHRLWDSPRLETARRQVEKLADRLGPWEMFAARFIYGTRMASMVFWGSRRLPLRRFVPIDLAAAVVSSVLLFGLGYAASGSATLMLGRVENVERWLLGAVVVVLLALTTWRRVASRLFPRLDQRGA